MAQVLISSNLATTSTLLLLFFFLSPWRTAASTTSPVVDIDGNPLEVGSEYYIQSAGFGFTGGLRLRPRPGFPSCPKFVYRTKVETDQGRPVKFMPADSTQKTIHLSTDLRIRFTGESTCGTVWQPTVDPKTGQVYVSTPGFTKIYVYNMFKIQKVDTYEGIYKISYSPLAGQEVVSGHLAIVEEYGINWLGLSDDPLHVFFVKKQS